MRSHQIEYQVFGDDLQFVEIELDPGETVIAEAGTMMYVEQGINFEAKMGDGTTPDAGFWGKAKQVGKRAITGESLFITHFTNEGHAKQKVAFAAPYPGKIVPVDLAQAGGRLLCQKDAFLAAAMGTTISINFSGKIGRGLFGGEGFILQDIQRSGSLKSMVLGGEGLFLATLQGTGWVWLQSLPFSRLAERVLANLAPGSSDDSGSVLGGLSNIFEKS